MRLNAQALDRFAQGVLRAAGADEASAAATAQVLLDADLKGIHSHGLVRLPIYVRRLEAGLANPRPVPRPLREEGPLVLLDGDQGLGPRVGLLAVELARERARAHGVGGVGVQRSTHFGAAGFYAEALAREGLLGLVLSNVEPDVVPYGGRRATLGTNPLAFAAPAPQGVLLVDLATSQVAMGKVFLARARGEAIPPDWGVDEEGRPTRDPHRVRALLPLGGPKGYALALMVEVLAGVLTGAGIAHGVGRMYDEWDRPQNVGHFFLALDPERLVGQEAFRERMGLLWQAIKATPPAPGFPEVLLPGEREARLRAERLATGVPLEEATVRSLKELGARYGLALEVEGA
ncbi:Dehydrogenase [Thermus sp. CCB_US3_UF1]|uniref:Ldh family oxidoreductase n=1 Tax=Thermus sp. CCB_US3_UF1 TaxID=1111069 RepID=UPI0002389577|nr:Ldh family oxidoreductase [Thermus sp. CCB_US3_UF1]AEV15165.1 Dehydrogenase [Thermus sp. CCB_US3_UF1]